MQPFTFRPAEASDLPEIVAIYNSTVPTRMVTADTEPVSVESRREWLASHTERYPLWVVENSENQTVGWVSLLPFYGRPAYAQTVEISIYLAEGMRGKGYGKAILLHTIEQAKGLNVSTLLAFIFSHNEPSIHLFRHAGFAWWGELPHIAQMDEEKYSLTILGLSIN